MTRQPATGAAVIGSGPNGLAAAVTLAGAGLPVTVYERNSRIGGGCRSAALIQSDVYHDIGSAVHALAAVSPAFRSLPLAEHGLTWITPPAALAHPFDDGTAVLLTGSIEETVSMLDAGDRTRYLDFMRPLVNYWDRLADEVLAFPRLFRHPLLMARFGLNAMTSTMGVATRFSGPRAKAVLGGLGAHSVMALHKAGSIAAGLLLGTAAHATGWPLPAGGSQRIADALTACLTARGGKIMTGHEVTNLEEIGNPGMLMLDVTPRQAASIVGNRFPGKYRRKLERYRYGPGVFKVDWLLDGPVPWRAAGCALAGTVHLGGTLEEIAGAEGDVMTGRVPERPFVLLVQPSLFDTERAPAGKHVVWAYCHVPPGCDTDMTERIEAQIERFAPGFRERIIEKVTMSPADIERDNPNCVGGDIAAGAQSLRRLLFPAISHRTPATGIYHCSAATAPGPGVHGMCGTRAARLALKDTG